MPIAALLTKKLGPLPVWGWMGIGTAGLLALGSAGKGKGNQNQQQQPLNNTQDPNAMGAYAGGVYGDSYFGGRHHGNGWTGDQHGHYQHSPIGAGLRNPLGHSGGWGGHHAGGGQHGLGHNISRRH